VSWDPPAPPSPPFLRAKPNPSCASCVATLLSRLPPPPRYGASSRVWPPALTQAVSSPAASTTTETACSATFPRRLGNIPADHSHTSSFFFQQLRETLLQFGSAAAGYFHEIYFFR
jgi:hypothetical protein